MTSFPLTERFVRAVYPPRWQETSLDPYLSMSDHLRRRHLDGDLPGLVAELQRAASGHPDDVSAAGFLAPWIDDPGVLQQHSPSRMLVVLLERARDALTDPTSVEVLEEDDLLPVRVSRFHDEAAATLACDVVLNRHAQELRAWADGFDGSLRRHFYADTGRPVGRVLDRRTRTWTEVSGVAVVCTLVTQTGPARVHDAYPEVPLDQSLRDRFPMLPHLFGGYFGDVPERLWQAQRTLHRSTFGPAKELAQAQLGALLELDDDDLRRAVEAFGSHLLPSPLRLWVQAIADRLEADEVVDEDGAVIDRWALYGPGPR